MKFPGLDYYFPNIRIEKSRRKKKVVVAKRIQIGLYLNRIGNRILNYSV